MLRLALTLPTHYIRMDAVPEIAFAQLTVQDLDRALSFYERRLGMRVLRQQELAGNELERLWGLPVGSHVRLAYLTQPGLERLGGLRLVQCQPASGSGLRKDLPFFCPGAIGYSMNVGDIEAATAAFREFGATQLSEPQLFSGPAGREDAWAMEVVLQMPASYYVMLYQVPPGSPRFHQLGLNGLSEIRSVNVVSRDPSQTDRFWRDVMGFELTVITDGISEKWNVSRGIPIESVIRSASFHSAGGTRGPFYSVAIPGLTKGLEVRGPDVSVRGFCLAGYRTSDFDALVANVVNAGYTVLAREEVDLAPWPTSRVASVQAPDGLIVELGEGLAVG